MATSTTVPVTISPEAMDLVKTFGVQHEFEQIIDHMQHTVPQLLRVEVSVALPYDEDDDLRIGIDVIKEFCGMERDTTEDDICEWKMKTFPTEIWLRFVILVAHVNSHGR